MSMKTGLPAIVSVLKVGADPKFVVVDYHQYKKFVKELDVPVVIDEDHYLMTHPDVKVAVASGRAESASVHFTEVGYFEGRRAKIVSGVQKRKR